MHSCEICKKDILLEDSFKCSKCGRIVCPDHATNQGDAVSDDINCVCTECMEVAHDKK